MKLSTATIARAKPRATPYELPDSEVPGLLLRVQPSGVRSFIVTWRRGRRKTIGRVGTHTLEQVRIKARRILLDAEEHGEPSVAAGRAATLREFIANHFKPYAEANHKDHVANLAAIETEFEHLYDRPLTAISAFDLERYRQAKLKDGVKPSTVNRHLDRIKSVFARALEWKAVPSHPLRGLKRSKVDRTGIVRFLSEKEESALRKALSARDAKMRAERTRANTWRAERHRDPYPEIPKDGFGDVLTPMVLLSANTGMRRGELRKIGWTDIDFDKAMLTIRGGYAKSGQTRYLPLNFEALDVLRRWRAQGASPDAVFPVLRVDKSWKAVLKAAKIDSFRWHDLRHSFASRLVQKGVDLNVVRELLGHQDIIQTLRYSHLSPEKKADAVARLAA